MYNALSKYGTLLGFGLGFIVVLISVLTIIFSFPAGASEAELMTKGFWSIPIMLTLALIILAVVAMVLMSIYSAVIDSKGIVRGLIGAGALLLLFLIMWLVFSSSEVSTLMETFNVSGGTGKFIEGLIKTSVTLVALGFLAMFASMIMSLFK